MLLVMDTATRRSVVAVGHGPRLAGRSHRHVGHRHGSHLLEQVDEALAAVGARPDDVSAIGVGTGPGSFTGLRVGLATAKTLAYARRLPIVGLASTDLLLRAARRAAGTADVVVVLPAGAHDHYLARRDGEVVLVAAGGLAEALPADRPVAAVDLGPDVLGAAAAALGEAAVDALDAVLVEAASERLLRGEADDAAAMVPRYVALPRGVAAAAGEVRWSPDLR